jgi:vacuolar-type H+-ATPase subunit C/Vma6
LREIAADGFPADYLLARVRGRRAALVSDWPSLAASGLPAGTTDESIWRALLEEFEWLYRQMDRSLRRCFAPVFMLFELKTIVLCVRNKTVQRTAEFERLLERSLLSDRLQQALRESPDVRSTVSAVVELLATVAPDLRALETDYAEEGLRGFENGLMRGYLAQVSATRMLPAIREFFAAFIDLRNLMILYKHLRWEIAGEAVFIRGGTLEPSRFVQAAARKELAGLEALAQEVTGSKDVPAAASEGALETVLLRRMTQQLRKAGRESEDVGLILDYVWRSYVQARNLAVLHHAGDLEPETLERELIA